MSMRRPVVLAALMAAFLAWQVPLMFRLRAGQDEDFYGVPGIAILRSGVPQIPYIPSRDVRTIYYRADELLYTLPPLGFYIEAAVHLVLGEGLGPARLASALMGMVAVALVYGLALAWFDDRRGAAFAAGFYLYSRAFWFPAITARPDMAAVAFGLGAVACAVRHRRAPGWRMTAAGGVAAGLSLLCHPLGVVPASQAGLTLLAGPGPLGRRIIRGAGFAAVALATAALWLPLIARHPDWFRIQFGGNVLGRAGPGLLATLRDVPSVLALPGPAVLGPRRADPGGAVCPGHGLGPRPGETAGPGREYLLHLAAAVSLLLLFMGKHHIRNYYAYPAALASVGVGMLAGEVAGRLERWLGVVFVEAWPLTRPPGTLSRRERVCGRWWRRSAWGCSWPWRIAPGAGLRVAASHLRHRDDPVYDVRSFTREILADIPPETLIAVDGAFVLEAYLQGRPVVEAIVDPFYFDVRTEPFGYAVFGPVGLKQVRPAMDDLVLVKSYGDPADPFGNYAELYRRSGGPEPQGGVTLPRPNWSPARIGRSPSKSISSIFSLWTARPCSSERVATTRRVAVSITSPVEG